MIIYIGQKIANHKRFIPYGLNNGQKVGSWTKFRVDDPKEYIQNFNWLSNWLENILSENFFEQLQLLLFIFITNIFIF